MAGAGGGSAGAVGETATGVGWCAAPKGGTGTAAKASAAGYFRDRMVGFYDMSRNGSFAKGKRFAD